MQQPGTARFKTETLSVAEQRGRLFAQSIGAPSLRELRGRSAEDLLKDQQAVSSFIVPILDGWFLPDDAMNIFMSGKQAQVPMLLGWNANEGDPLAAPMQLEGFRDHANRQYGTEGETFLRLYPASGDRLIQQAYSMYFRDLAVAFPMRTWARLHRQTGKSPVFLFFFNRVPPDEPTRGAHHGSELTYAFHNMRVSARPFEDADRHLADVMSSYWVQFATTGDPNGKDLPKWPAYDERNDNALWLGDEIKFDVIPNKSVLDFFERFYGRGPRNTPPH